MILIFHYSCNVCKAFRNRDAEHSKNVGIRRSKTLTYCCYELCRLCKDGVLILDTSTVTPIFTLEPPLSLLEMYPCVPGWASSLAAPGLCCLFFVLLVLRPTQSFNQDILKVKGGSPGQLRCLTLKAKASFYGLLLRHWYSASVATSSISSTCNYFASFL